MKRQTLGLVACGALLVASTIVEAAGYIDTAAKFLTAWGRGNWEELATVAADRVIVSVDGKDSVIDVTSKKTDVTLVFPFKGLSTVRTGGAVTGVSVDDITVMVKGEEKKGKGTLTLAESDGKITVVKVAVQ
jgi:hypothetical protein